LAHASSEEPAACGAVLHSTLSTPLAKEKPKMDIREHMEVVDSTGKHVGTVDKVEGERIKLTRKDSGDGQEKG
jgi:rRNA processing protein Gar1